MGFQMLELIVTLSVILTLGGISVLALGKLRTNRLLRDEAQHLKSTIESLILRATQEETGIELMLFQDRYEAYIAKPQARISMRKLKIPVHIDSVAPQPPLHFAASGVSQPAHIILKGKEDICEVKIGLRGRVLLSCN